MLKEIILFSPILYVSLVSLCFFWIVKLREKKHRIQKQIIKSGDRGEHKVQSALKVLEHPNSRYKVYHNVKLGPDPVHTNEYDTLVVGPNGIFHIETKNYGGERGGIIEIDSNNNWILHKKSGFSKMVPSPMGQLDSHEYRLRGFLAKYVRMKNIPTQGIIVLSCDDLVLRRNTKIQLNRPVLNRHELVYYIKRYRGSNLVLYPRTIKKICRKIEAMNKMAWAQVKAN